MFGWVLFKLLDITVAIIILIVWLVLALLILGMLFAWFFNNS